jgi:hypothetical protein
MDTAPPTRPTREPLNPTDRKRAADLARMLVNAGEDLIAALHHHDPDTWAAAWQRTVGAQRALADLLGEQPPVDLRASQDLAEREIAGSRMARSLMTEGGGGSGR